MDLNPSAVGGHGFALEAVEHFNVVDPSQFAACHPATGTHGFAPAHQKPSWQQYESLRAKFGELFSNAEDLASFACKRITPEDFQTRLAQRETELVDIVKRAYHAIELAHHSVGSHKGAFAAVAPSPAPAQLDCSLVPFCASVWLAMSLRYCSMDARGTLVEAKAFNVRLLLADLEGAGVLEMPPWGNATPRAVCFARAQISGMVSDLAGRGVHVTAVRLGQGLLPLLSDAPFNSAMHAVACAVRPSKAFQFVMDKAAEAQAAAAAAKAAATPTTAAAQQMQQLRLQQRARQWPQVQHAKRRALSPQAAANSGDTEPPARKVSGSLPEAPQVQMQVE